MALNRANLQHSRENLSGVSSLRQNSFQGRVYNLTPYLSSLPDGDQELRHAVGKDGENLFVQVHPWVNWRIMLEGCLVVLLVDTNASHISSEQPTSHMLSPSLSTVDKHDHKLTLDFDTLRQPS
jgi:hypothetical protein